MDVSIKVTTVNGGAPHFRAAGNQNENQNLQEALTRDLVVRNDVEISDTAMTRAFVFRDLSEAVKSGARNITDFISTEPGAVWQSVWDIKFLLENGAHGKRSLPEMARLFEEESARVRGLTDISEREKAVRLMALEQGFISVAGSSLMESARGDNWSRNENTLREFAGNAARQIQSIGVSDETKRLMTKGLDRVVSDHLRVIQREATMRAVAEHLRRHGRLTTEELRIIAARNETIRARRNEELRNTMDEFLSWLNGLDDTVPGAEGVDAEDDGEETSSEVAESDDAPNDYSPNDYEGEG